MMQRMISRRASCDSFGISEMISALLMLEKYTPYARQSTFARAADIISDTAVTPTQSSPGGLLEMSKHTRLTPLTSLMMRLESFSSSSYGSFTQSAVMPSCDSTARMAMV